MNTRRLELDRFRRLGLMVLLLATAIALGSASGAAAQDPIYWIHRALGYHGFQVEGVGEFTVETSEEIEASAVATGGAWKLDRAGLSTLPLAIVGMAGRGHAEGLGETVYWLDKSRPVEGSGVRAKSRGANFPAVQEMRFHLLLTTEILPGRTFRSINPAVMVNNNATVFPPRLGTRYALQRAIEFEDVNEPGVVVLRIVSNRNQIVGVGRDRWSPEPRLEQN